MQTDTSTLSSIVHPFARKGFYADESTPYALLAHTRMNRRTLARIRDAKALREYANKLYPPAPHSPKAIDADTLASRRHAATQAREIATQTGEDECWAAANRSALHPTRLGYVLNQRSATPEQCNNAPESIRIRTIMGIVTAYCYRKETRYVAFPKKASGLTLSHLWGEGERWERIHNPDAAPRTYHRSNPFIRKHKNGYYTPKQGSVAYFDMALGDRCEEATGIALLLCLENGILEAGSIWDWRIVRSMCKRAMKKVIGGQQSANDSANVAGADIPTMLRPTVAGHIPQTWDTLAETRESVDMGDDHTRAAHIATARIIVEQAFGVESLESMIFERMGAGATLKSLIETGIGGKKKDSIYNAFNRLCKVVANGV